MEEEEAAAAAVVAVSKKRKQPLAAHKTDDVDSDLEVGFRSASESAAADSDPPPPLLPTLTPQRDAKAATLLDENVEEFYAILRRVHGLTTYLKKQKKKKNNNNNADGDLNWLPSTTMSVGLDGVCDGGPFCGGQGNNSEDEVRINAVCFDLNASPQPEEEDFA